MERSQHAGDIADRRLLDSPLRERPGRLSLEVDNQVIFSRVEDLPEMKVAMNPGAFGCYLSRKHRAETIQHFSLKIKHPQCFVEHNTTQCTKTAFQQLEHLPGVVPHGLVQRSLIQQRKRLRDKIRFFGIQGKCAVQFPGLPPEKFHIPKEGPVKSGPNWRKGRKLNRLV